MTEPDWDNVPLIAGSGGVLTEEIRTSHSGRKALMLTRQGNPSEFLSLSKTMDIDVVEIISQKGRSNPRLHFGRGRLEAIRDELRMAPESHPWFGIDLILVNANLTPRQLVNLTDLLQCETWDRVRLLLELFTQHASSVEARNQVRIARLNADRNILRELVNRETTGERLGFGAGGRTGWNIALSALSRELQTLKNRQKRYGKVIKERQRQRKSSGAKTVGLAGYTNAGKSSLFAALCGKPVLVEDRYFSTLETTVGRMQFSPRILLVDTIGFIDEIPSDLLDAFSATLLESIDCDLLLLLLDASDSIPELIRKFETSRRELFDRTDHDLEPYDLQVVLTKSDSCSDEHLVEVQRALQLLSVEDAVVTSSSSSDGIEDLRSGILTRLHGPPIEMQISDTSLPNARPLAAIESQIRRMAMVREREVNDQGLRMIAWIDPVDWFRLQQSLGSRISEIIKTSQSE
ncbi:MAG: GTPase [Candidatus Thalassarchaeaceae archaeon]|nr:MAG: hypothetical protein CMA04_006250 [Euryarchaeota archaeon]RPG74815.1 MAG: HflX family GTPase [Euryarchaeota archaeon TMED85]|tara:strand:+ start:8603 stop:9988 length:1386 start_codon:yes stop_codon:yes gene_type:complete